MERCLRTGQSAGGLITRRAFELSRFAVKRKKSSNSVSSELFDERSGLRDTIAPIKTKPGMQGITVPA